MRARKSSRPLTDPSPPPKTARGPEFDSRPRPPAWRQWIGISLTLIGPLSAQGAEFPEPPPVLAPPLSSPSASPSPLPSPSPSLSPFPSLSPSAPPFPRTPPPAQAHERMGDALAPSLRVVADSARFALTFPGKGWFAVDPQSEARFAGLDLAVFHREGGGLAQGSTRPAFESRRRGRAHRRGRPCQISRELRSGKRRDRDLPGELPGIGPLLRAAASGQRPQSLRPCGRGPARAPNGAHPRPGGR